MTNSFSTLSRDLDSVAAVRDACANFRVVADRLRQEIGRVLVGQSEVVDQVLIALFADGHVLLEGVPGLGKTLLVRTLGQALGLKFSRIQFTPDLMPADILGTQIVVEDQATGQRDFNFGKGRSSHKYCLQMKSIELLPRVNLRCSKRCKSAASRSAAKREN